MDRNIIVAVRREWLLNFGTHPKRVNKHNLCPIGINVGHFKPDCRVLVKFRSRDGSIFSDASSRLIKSDDEYFLKSPGLCQFLASSDCVGEFVLLFFEGTETDGRCVVSAKGMEFFVSAEQDDPTLRLFAYGLPPESAMLVDSPRILTALYRILSSQDSELFATHANAFLDAPHILIPLFAHAMSLRSEDDVNFTIQLKKIAEQLRTLLRQPSSSVRIEALKRSHLDLWAEVQNCRVAFLDGGVARIPSIAGIEPMALRVGVYSVRPGVRTPAEREQWSMTPFVVRDLLDPSTVSELTDRRRLQEAARYVLEPLTALFHARTHPDTKIVFLHGPLVNQFVMYDEGEPHYIPSLAASFLESYGITKKSVRDAIRDIPVDAHGEPLWNQFMAVYGFITRSVYEEAVPLIGVVERAGGRSLSEAILQRLVNDRIIDEAYVIHIRQILERYEITDDFLFGCMLREGEYVTPVPLGKNWPRRARHSWQPVVRQYASPFGTMLKSEDSRFPFRVEMNKSGFEQASSVLRIVYHTARLLPQYAFPVGLDIADKYAKVPDWISRGVSLQMSAQVLKRALRTGDARLVAQVRQLLARGPRDFFFRPSHEI